MHLKKIKEHFGYKRLSSVTPTQVKNWTAKLQQERAVRELQLRSARPTVAALQGRDPRWVGGEVAVLSENLTAAG